MGLNHSLKDGPQFIVVDLFCGAGGTSVGFDRAKYKGLNIAEVIACINHDPLAIRNHGLNFPECIHFTEDVRNMDLRKLKKIVDGFRQKYPNAKLILWASLECTHFSNAKTGSRDADSRTLAWVLYDYEAVLKPELIMIENVREFMSWGPLTGKVTKVKGGGDYCELSVDKKTGFLSGNFVPESRKKGIDYIKWKQTIEKRGYRYSSKLLNSADFGSYQSRLRYFGIFARPELPIHFPKQTHDKAGRHGMPRWKAVREVLDLHEIGNSIFKRKKDLSPNTLKRIMAGLLKFVANGQQAYLVKNYGGDPDGKAVSLEQPAPTITTIPHEMLLTAYMIRSNGGDPKDRVSDIDSPTNTLTTSPNQQLVSTDFLCQYNGTPENCNFPTDSASRTITTKDRFALVRAWMDNQYGNGGDERGASSLDDPSGTLLTVPKKNLVHALFIQKYLSNPTGGVNSGWSLDTPGPTITTQRTPTIISAEFLMPTNYGNEPVSLDNPSPTLTANRKWHYLLNPQFDSAGGSIDDACFTLIAKMDKRPPSLVTIEPEVEGDPQLIFVDPVFFKDTDVDILTRIRVFMSVYGIRDIYMRMLNIPELKRIQGLNMVGEPEYILEGPKDQQKKHIGNAVEPRVVTAWIQDYHAEFTGRNITPKLELFS